MSSERETCGLGSFIPMNCRGRAEAFARRLQSRLQTLGRSGSGLDESADESSWIGRQSSITSCQPRLSSSSDSDIFFDFDLDTPGSPEEEVPPSSTSRHETHEIDSGSALSLSTTERTSPTSEESSDERYFDPECSDCESSKSEASIECKHKHKPPVSNDGSQKSKIIMLCNGHIADTGTERSNVRSKDELNHSPTSVTERHNKLNISKLEHLKIDNNEDGVSCCVSNNDDKCTTENSSTGEKCANLVPDLIKTPKIIQNGSTHKFDNFSQSPSTSSSAKVATVENEDSILDDLTKNGQTDNQNINVTSVCSCKLNSDKNSISEPVLAFANDTDCLALLKENGEISQSDHEHESDLQHCCSTFHRPKNLLIDCATLSSDIEQRSVLVPLIIEPKEKNDAEETTEADLDPNIEIESLKHTDDDTCDEDDEDERPRRLRRSSSLKTGKTPPGTPGRKKIVRFADVLGLDLADVRTFLDEVPWVPQSAYQDLQNVDVADSVGGALQNNVPEGIASYTRRAEKCLVPMFQQPGNQTEFLDKVRERQVCLESAVVTDTIFFTISGLVRVRNLDFHKSVYIRYTLDGWKTFSDLKASYINGSCDGFSDKFSFKLYAHTVTVGSKVEFAIRFQCRGTQYWDNNLGANYTFQCLPPIAPSVTSMPLVSPVDETWTASFY